MKPSMRREIEAKVHALLTATGTNVPAIDVTHIAQHLRVPVHYEVLPRDISGFLHRNGDEAFVVVNKKNPRTRQRFTIAHEIGHLVFNHNRDQVHVDKTYLVGLRRDGKPLSGTVKFRKDLPGTVAAHDPEEAQANAFAGELLMPRKMLEADLSHALAHGYFDDNLLEGLSERYDVSIQALLIQLNTLNLTFTLVP